MGNPVEPQPLAALDAESAKLPHVAREFGLPPAAAVQVLQTAIGVAQKRRLPVLAVSGSVIGVEELDPTRRRPIQQRGHPAGGHDCDDRPRDASGGLDLSFIVSALQCVLHLQFELSAITERSEVEPVVAVGLAEHDELVDVGASRRLPPRSVVDAKRRASLCPQCAVGQRAYRMVGILHEGNSGYPGGTVGLTGPFPNSVMANA